MKIASIRAQNYRTLENVQVTFGDTYCSISGKNNAGKSCVIDLLSNMFNRDDRPPWMSDDDFDYKADITQWKEDDGASIVITYHIRLGSGDDAALITFLGKLSDTDVTTMGEHELRLSVTISPDSTTHDISFDDCPIEGSLQKDVIQKLKTSSLMFLHNSPDQSTGIYTSDRRTSLVEFVLSETEREQITQEEKAIQESMRRLAKQHKEEIQDLVDLMREKYVVDFGILEGSYARHTPLSVQLADSQVNAPLNAWGSGTRNKTHILLSILWASRIRSQGAKGDRTTPIVVIEEPESFLHPTAQAEFGRVLASLADDLRVQIIVTTHSPYMLDRRRPDSNILIRRPVQQNKPQGSEVLVGEGEGWMLPFAEHLGIPEGEFKAWRPLFSAAEKTILLVEGKTDVSYLAHLRKHALVDCGWPEDVEVVPYGGKDALRNTALLKFVLEKYDHAFITFDLDARKDVCRTLEAIGYEEEVDYFAVGRDRTGHMDMEGLLPERIRRTVYAARGDLVADAIGGDRKAKQTLKRQLLEEFLRNDDYAPDEIEGFQDLVTRIGEGMKRRATDAKGGTGAGTMER